MNSAVNGFFCEEGASQASACHQLITRRREGEWGRESIGRKEAAKRGCHGYRDGGRKGGLREVGDGMSDELTCA